MSDQLASDIEEQQMMKEMFVSNALEFLDQIESDLMTLEGQGEDFDSDIVNRVFRAAHTIKGESGFISMKTIGKLAHSIEELLDLMRDRVMSPTPKIVSTLLSGFDDLRRLIEDIDNSERANISKAVAALNAVKSGSNAVEIVAVEPVTAKIPTTAVVHSHEVVTPRVSDHHQSEVSNSASVRVERPTARSSQITPAQVLVVDDDKLMCKLLRHHLEKAGIPVDTAMSESEARQMMHTKFYRVVLCDIELGIDERGQKYSCGIDLIPQLKQIYPLTQIIMLTGNVSASNILNAIERGATDFMSKRDNINNIIKCVEDTLARAERWSPLMLGTF
jgi:chemotaxis protein histidine kinase CheA